MQPLPVTVAFGLYNAFRCFLLAAETSALYPHPRTICDRRSLWLTRRSLLWQDEFDGADVDWSQWKNHMGIDPPPTPKDPRLTTVCVAIGLLPNEQLRMVAYCQRAVLYDSLVKK